jgi:glucose-1-phosphate adenylyltransferase
VDEETGFLKSVGKNAGVEKDANICMEIFVMSKEKLVSLIYNCAKKINEHNIYNILFDELANIDINTYYYDGFVSCINTVAAYYETNMKMLDLDVSNQLFRLTDRPIYTKIKDEPPTQYIKGCHVENALIADGCVIEGNIKNSLIGRYVDVEEGAEVSDCIILQNIRIHKGAKLSHVIVDKNVDIESDTILKGNKVFPLVIEKKNLIK